VASHAYSTTEVEQTKRNKVKGLPQMQHLYPLLQYTQHQSLPFEAIDRSLSLIDRLNTRQAIDFSIAY